VRLDDPNCPYDVCGGGEEGAGYGEWVDGGDEGDGYGEWADVVAEPVPIWTKFVDPKRSIWFHDVQLDRYFIPADHGILYITQEDRFMMMDDPPQTSGEWILEVDAQGVTQFHNTVQPVLSFHYKSVRKGDRADADWRHIVERVEDSDGRSQTRPVGFRDNANVGEGFALADVGTPACNWNRVFYKGVPHWINVDDRCFELKHKHGQIFREDECEEDTPERSANVDDAAPCEELLSTS